MVQSVRHQPSPSPRAAVDPFEETLLWADVFESLYLEAKPPHLRNTLVTGD